MSTVPIAAVMIDPENRLRIYPDVSEVDRYEYIYRDASGVRWSNEDRCLYSQVPKELSYQEWFEIIRDAVKSEYGDELILTTLTDWNNVANEVRTYCESKALWKPA